jgi:hypothetical protein
MRRIGGSADEADRRMWRIDATGGFEARKNGTPRNRMMVRETLVPL